jgi:hypothetical protein
MGSGSVIVEWDAAGHLNIKSSLPLVASENKKAVIDKLLDAARAVNGLGTTLEMPNLSGARILSPN